MKKRFLPLALVLVMSLSLLPTSAFAVTQWTAKEVASCTYNYYDPDGFSEGVIAMSTGNGWGYVDRTGKEIIPGKYYWAEPFHDGLARVGTDHPRYGFIDKTGKVVIPLKYEECPARFSGGCAVVNDGTGYEMIDTTGKTVIPKQKYGKLNPLSEGLAGAAIIGNYGWQWGFIDRNGNEVIPFQYDRATSFYNGIAAVVVREWDGTHWNYGWGLIDKSGTPLTPFIYDEIEHYTDGELIRVQRDKKWGYINRQGEEVIPCQYKYADEFSEGFAVVGDESGYGLINEAGEVIAPLKYWAVCDCHDGLVRFNVYEEETKEVKYGYMDTTGKEIVPAQYRWAEDFSEGLAVVSKSGQGTAVINTAGNIVVPFNKYKGIRNYCCGLAVVMSMEDKYGVIDRTGKEIVPPQYDFIEFLFKSNEDYDRAKKRFAANHALAVGQKDASGEMKYGIIAFEAVEIPAYASPQSVLIDGSPVEFQCYALKDENGNPTNYVKLRDVASVLNGTSAQFNVGWDGAVNIETGKDYTPNGTEMSTPFSGDRSYDIATAPTNVNGETAALDAIVLKDDKGGAYTYYKLRDLGTALSFTVDWSAEKGVFIETE